MPTKSRHSIYGASVRAAADRAKGGGPGATTVDRCGTRQPSTVEHACAGTRNLAMDAYMSEMNETLSPEKAARLERRRVAAEDGSKALQEVLDAAIAVRANMARLRALRLAKEADGVIEPDGSKGTQPTAPRRKR